MWSFTVSQYPKTGQAVILAYNPSTQEAREEDELIHSETLSQKNKNRNKYLPL
jgi:hypothetical protein